jgi:GNAT superfamily N-acetyltransferase
MTRIRPFRDTDCDRLVEILELNGQYEYLDIEGPDAMRRVASCDAAVFLVAESGGVVQGLVRGVYDGARAMINQMSIYTKAQLKGIGAELLKAIEAEFRRRGSPGVLVTVSETSVEFWKKQGFEVLPVQLMLKPSI